ncbi:MAG: hypothetical protein V1835_01735 [Candidatus Micrarchaeota archaeon]
MAKHKEKKFSIFGMRIGIEYLLGFLLIAFIVGYALTKIAFFGYLTLGILLVLFLKDVLPSSTDKKSVKSSLWELGIALAAALGLWYGLGFVLQTPTPIDVVTSCSMLPFLDRGDLIILQGGEVHATTIEITAPIQLGDFITKDCKVRDLATGNERKDKCIVGLKVDGVPYQFDTAGDVVVYEPQNAFRNTGLIVHRAVLKLKYKGEYYILIKGDNNLSPDIFGISSGPAKQEQIKGRTILRVPWVGYLKLFLSFQFDEPPNCKYIVEQ